MTRSSQRWSHRVLLPSFQFPGPAVGLFPLQDCLELLNLHQQQSSLLIRD